MGPRNAFQGCVAFNIFCHKCHSSHFSNITFSSGAFCLLSGTSSEPKTHPGFQPGRPRSLGPSTGVVVKALSMVRDKECFSLARFIMFFVFCNTTGNPPLHPQILPSPHRPSSRFWVPLAGPKHTLGSNHGPQGPRGPVYGWMGRHFHLWWTQQCFSVARFSFFYFFLPKVPHLPSLRVYARVPGA